jgi:MFS family permease
VEQSGLISASIALYRPAAFHLYSPRNRYDDISRTNDFLANFRFWFVGQLISLFGTWMQTTALGFYAFELTLSKAFLGTVVFATGLPTLIFMFVGGMTAEHLPRRRLIMITQTSMMVLAGLLSLFTFLKVTTPPLLVVFALLNGVVNSFDAPARQSFLLEMVDRKSLSNAIALNSGIFTTATAVGPAFGGILYAFFGPAWCFLINAISFGAVILSLGLMKLNPARRERPPLKPLSSILDGFRYIRREPLIRSLILLAAAVSVFGFSIFTLFPAWAVNVLHGDSVTNGFLQSARGCGSLVAALLIAAIGRVSYRGKLITGGTFLFPAALIIFAFITNQPLSFVIVFIAGLGMMFVFNLANAVIQDRVKDEYRGRVMSVYSLTFFGLMPLGALALGALADAVGSQAVVIGSSLMLIGIAVAVLMLMDHIRSA